MIVMPGLHISIAAFLPGKVMSEIYIADDVGKKLCSHVAEAKNAAI